MSPSRTPTRRAATRRQAVRRGPARRSQAKRRGSRRRRRSRRPLLRRIGWAGLLVILVVVGLAAYGISRIDFGETIRELTLPLEHEDLIRQEAGDEDVARTAADGEISLPETDPALIAAVINAESGFRDRTSRAGARGLMQITHDTADTIEKLSGGETFEYDDLADPELNIRYGSFYLRYLLHLFEGNETAALVAYNAGPTNAWNWGGTSLGVEDIRFPETRAYVEKILRQRRDYRRTYGDELGF